MAITYSLNLLNALAQSFRYIQLFADPPPASITDPDPTNPIAFFSYMELNWNGVDNTVSLNPNAISPFVVTQDGTIQSYRTYIYQGAQCTSQGTVSLPGNGGDLILDTIDVIAGQVITINEFTMTINISAA